MAFFANRGADLASTGGSPVFDASSIQDVVHVLAQRQASVWHACQLTDYDAYLRLGGIASRAALERANLSFTELMSDPIDRHNGHWDRIFLSLEDIGQGFARGWNMHPNVFGPIALQIRPGALTEAVSAQICLRPPSSPGFDPESDLVETLDGVDQLFLNKADADFPWSTHVRFGSHLQEAFSNANASTAEMLISRSDGLVDLAEVVAVWVDPVVIGDQQLIDVVDGLAQQHGVPLRIRRRTLLEGSRYQVWRDIACLLADGERPLIQLVNRHDASPAFREWGATMMQRGLGWMWDRFARYLYNGTLAPMGAGFDTGSGEPPRQPVPVPSGPPSHVPGDRMAARVGSATAPVSTERRATQSVRSCGHLVQPWDGGTCYACVGATRSAWRYD